MKRKILAGILAVWMILALAACGGKEETPEDTKTSVEEPAPEKEPEKQPVAEPESAPEPAPEPEPEVYVPAGTNPLTGEPMEPEYENDRPVAVMFNNLKEALPQLGISQADIIYEIPAEGGVTRMLGVFQSLEGVETLGSIRSTRAYYLEAALGHDAILVHAGGSPEAYEDIPNWGVNNIDGVRGGPSQDVVFWRDAERRKNAGYEHSLLTSGEKILEYLGKGKYRTEHKDTYQYTQNFAQDGTPKGGSAAERFKLYYTTYKTGVFQYDAEKKQYMISEYGSPYVDGNTGEQVGATNVLVLETSINIIRGDKEGRLTVKMSGSGEGTYFCGGKCVPIQWSKADRNSQFVYKLKDGTPLTLGEGTSYVCIMDPSNSTLAIGE